MLNKIFCIILYRILDSTLILSMNQLSKIYHILFKPAINYNYYMLIPIRNKNFLEFVIVGQFKHNNYVKIENKEFKTVLYPCLLKN